MGYIKKNKFTLKETAKIISEETAVPHKIEDLLQLAEADKIRITIYKPKLVYFQENAASTGQNLIHSANENIVYPLLSFKSITHFLVTRTRKVIENLDNIDAVDIEGSCFKITSYTGDNLIEVRKKDLFILDIQLERYLSQHNDITSNALCKSTSKPPKTKILDKRIESLKKLLKVNPNISPHNHKYTRLEIWEKLNKFDDTLFPEWKNTTQNGRYKFELDGIAKTFLASKEVKNLISFQ